VTSQETPFFIFSLFTCYMTPIRCTTVHICSHAPPEQELILLLLILARLADRGNGGVQVSLTVRTDFSTCAAYTRMLNLTRHTCRSVTAKINYETWYEIRNWKADRNCKQMRRMGKDINRVEDGFWACTGQGYLCGPTLA
jgi:hypothetical protein